MNEDHVKQNNCLSCLKNSKSLKSFLFVSYSALSSSCSVHRLLDCIPLPIRLTHVAAVSSLLAVMAATALLLLALSASVSLTGKRHSHACKYTIYPLESDNKNVRLHVHH